MENFFREDLKDPNSYLVLDSKTNKLARHDAPGVVPQLQVKDNPEYKTVLTMVLEQKRNLGLRKP